MNKLTVTALATALVLPVALGDLALAASHGHGATPESVAKESTAMMPMHEQMEQMQALTDRMQRSSSPKERRELMRQHMESMQGMMKMMHGMMAGQSMMKGKPGMDMMGRGQAEPPAGAGHGHEARPSGAMAGKGDDLGPRMMMMEERMNMMQMMMDQMLQNQDALQKGEEQDD